MQYKGANVTVMVSDFNRAVSFYTETLGLELRARYGDNWAEVVAPGLTIGLHPAGHRQVARGEALSIGFEVADLATVKAELQAKGVGFPAGVRDTDTLLIANFTDPDGTPLSLTQMKPR